jgi:hypothetical protein
MLIALFAQIQHRFSRLPVSYYLSPITTLRLHETLSRKRREARAKKTQ